MIRKNDLPADSYSTQHRGVKAYCGRENVKVLVVDVKKAEFHGTKIKDLGTFAKRKFENMLFLSHSMRNRVNIVYE